MRSGVRSALDTPWKVTNHALRVAALPRTRLLFVRNRIAWGTGWQLFGTPIIQRHRRSEMRFGDGLRLRSTIRSNPLGPSHPVMLTTFRAGSRLIVGSNFQMTGGTLCASEHIEIGDDVMIGSGTMITDSDFHPLSSEERLADSSNGSTAAVHIEDGVFVGANCIILKGVTLGRNCVVGAGSVVAKSVPPGAIAAGNPARVVGSLARATEDGDNINVNCNNIDDRTTTGTASLWK